MASLAAIGERAQSCGLALRGAFHPQPREFERQLPRAIAATIVLLGFTGGRQWDQFQRSAEARDGMPHPLDRWSRRVIGALAKDLGAVDAYPAGSVQLPFQQLALRSEPVHRSPIGLLIHPAWGLWHAYRGALIFSHRIELPVPASSASPCAACSARPCLQTCPVSAFRAGSFDVRACTDHLQSEAGAPCREGGCLARRACPVGREFTYSTEQMRFHMRAFMQAAHP